MKNLVSFFTFLEVFTRDKDATIFEIRLKFLYIAQTNELTAIFS